MANSNSNKRLTSTKKYIDGLQEIYSKINVVRLDLSYKKQYSPMTSLDDANKDLNNLFNNMRSKPSIFKDKVGYVIKKEYTEDRGVHFHAMLIFDGQKVKQSSFKAKQIGEYWQNITKQKGSFHNCHRNKYDNNGIGIIDHTDTKKKEILVNKVISYLCKDEQSIEPFKNKKNNRSLIRGVIPKKESNIGRPRKNTSK